MSKVLEKIIEKALAKELGEETGLVECPFEIGGKYFIRTVTYFATGQVKRIVGNFIELEDAAWVADTGRFRTAIMEGILDEVEPVEVPMYINMNSIVDAFVWKFKLPREQK